MRKATHCLAGLNGPNPKLDIKKRTLEQHLSKIFTKSDRWVINRDLQHVFKAKAHATRWETYVRLHMPCPYIYLNRHTIKILVIYSDIHIKSRKWNFLISVKKYRYKGLFGDCFKAVNFGKIFSRLENIRIFRIF